MTHKKFFWNSQLGKKLVNILNAFSIMQKKIFLDFSILFMFILSLCFRSFVPPAIVINSPHDDLLGVTLAQSMLSGDWLGDWNNRTLVKPPLYSIFLALNHFTNLTPTVVIHFLYLVVALFGIKTLLKIFSHWTQRAQNLSARFAFFYLAFNPVLFGYDFSKIHRITLNTVLAFLFVILFIRFVIALNEQFQNVFSNTIKASAIKIPTGLAGTSVSIGLVYAGLVLTRSEAMWLLYPAIATILILLISRLKFRGNRSRNFNSIKFISTAVLISVFSFSIPTAFIASMNQKYYGSSLIENYFAGEFERAITLWEGVLTGVDERSFISVSKGQRDAVYAISPTSQELRPFLEGAPNTGWKSANCATTNVCDESGAWFTWELRDAATSARDMRSERDFQLFFRDLANEISIGCTSKKIECGIPGFTSGIKPLNQIPFHQFIDFTSRALLTVLDFDSATNVGRSDPGGSVEQNQIWRSVLNYNIVVTNSNFEQWKTLGSTVTALKRIYVPLTLILFLIFLLVLVSFTRIKSSVNERLIFVFLFFSIALFLFGIGILDVNAGFSTAFSLYTLPVQPVFLFLLIFSAYFGSNLVMKVIETPNLKGTPKAQ
jgi:hypothetical protein